MNPPIQIKNSLVCLWFQEIHFDNPKLVKLMNDVYANEISLLFNFFYPCIKLVDKVRIESSIKKKYDKAQTPYQRLMTSSGLTLEQKKTLQDKFITLDPFDLQKNIQKKLKLLFKPQFGVSSRLKKGADAPNILIFLV